MNEIKLRNNNGEILASSREVAEHFEKRHKNVLQSIKNLTAKNSAMKNMFIESEYISSRGREEKEYLMTRDGFSLLVMGFTGVKALEWKLKYIDAFNKMEQLIKSQYQGKYLPKNYKEALVQLVEQIEINEQLESTIEKNKPFVKFASTVTKADNMIDVNTMSKMIQEKNHIDIGRNRLYELLRKKKILMKNNEPYQDYIDRGWFKLIEVVIKKGNKIKTGSKTLITGFGQVKITNIVLNEFENALAMMQ